MSDEKMEGTYLTEINQFVANCEAVFDLEKYGIPGVPDGMTMDSDGNLWVAVFDGGRILHINPQTKELINTITFPAKQVKQFV